MADGSGAPVSRDLPAQSRAASFLPASFDAEKRTVDLVWSTGAAVQRYNFWTGKRYSEELSLDPAHVDLSRLANGAPLLIDHRMYDSEAVVGVVERAWIEAGEGKATVRFSEDPDAQRVAAKVREGVLRNISITYSVRKYEVTEEQGKDPVYRAVDWQPMEISFVPVGADAAAGTRAAPRAAEFPCLIETRGQPAPVNQEKKTMTTQTTTAGQPGQPDPTRAAPPPPVLDEAAIRAEARAAERKRASDIRARVRSVSGLDEDFAAALIERGVEGDAIGTAIVDELAKRGGQPARPALDTGVGYSPENPEIAREIAVEALTARATRNLSGEARVAPTERSRDLARLPMLEMLAEHARACGVKLDRHKRGSALYDDLVQARGLATGDFPLILANVGNKIMVKAYEQAQPTYRLIAERRTFNDFRPHNFLRFGDFPAMAQKNESGEFTYGAISEAQNPISADEFGRIVKLTRRMLVNDDMDAFSQLPAMAARRTVDFESRQFYAMFALNSGNGPTIFEKNMPSGRPLFHAADHLNLAGSGTAIDVTNVGIARAAMRKQQSLDGMVLNIAPRYLLTGPDRETQAEQFCAVNIVAATDTNANPFKGRLTPISDANLTGNAWHLFADPADGATFAYGYVDGQEGPRLLSRDGFTYAGMEMLVAIDWACGALDYRFAYKNPGA
jgi:HK97 family phage prohead protease